MKFMKFLRTLFYRTPLVTASLDNKISSEQITNTPTVVYWCTVSFFSKFSFTGSSFRYRPGASSHRGHDINGVGGRGYPKLVTKSDIGRRRVHANSDITTQKNYL